MASHSLGSLYGSSRILSFLSCKMGVVPQLCAPGSGGLTEGEAGRGWVNPTVGRGCQAADYNTCVRGRGEEGREGACTTG